MVKRILTLGLLPLLLLTGLAQAGQPAATMPLRLQAGTFDPLYEQLPASAVGELAAGEIGPYYIVQFRGPVRAAWADQAEALGATLLGYLPENAYVARLAADDLPKLRSLPAVRWVGPYQPAYKLMPALGRSARAVPAGQRLDLTIVGFPGEPADALKARLGVLGASVEGLSDTPLGPIGRISLAAGQLDALSRLPAVSWLERYVAPRLDNAEGRKIMNAESVWESNGLFGAGQIVAISDSGLSVQNALSTDFGDRLVRAFAPSEMRPDDQACSNKQDWTDLNGHGTHVAGSVLGNGANSGSNPAGHLYTSSNAGIAPEARFVFMAMNTDGTLSIQCVPSNGNYIAFGYQNGARISSNSWGSSTQGAYTANDSVIDDYIWRNRDYLVLFSAGNSGPNPRTVGSPGSAKNIISVGASESNRPAFPGVDPVNGGSTSDDPDSMAYFSSRGPTADGRVKPDIVAPGTNIVSVLGAQAGGLEPVAPGQPYAASSGTSMATPLSAGAATLVREWLVTQRGISNPSAALIKALMIHGAVRLPEAAIPNSQSGWGRVDLKNTIGARFALFEDNLVGLRTGESATYEIIVAGATPDGTLIVGPGLADPQAVATLSLTQPPIPAAATQEPAADPSLFSLEPVPGYGEPWPGAPIPDDDGSPRADREPLSGLPLPSSANARQLVPADGPSGQNYPQSMVGGGDFEDPGWTNIWSRVWIGQGLPVRVDGSEPGDQVLSGQYSIWLGGSPSDDRISYPVSFPDEIDDQFPSSLTFLASMTDLDVGFDTFCVALTDASGYPIDSANGPLIACADALPPGTQSFSIPLGPIERAALAGQTGYLSLFTDGDGEEPHMSAYVDNISLTIDFAPVDVEALPDSGPAGTTFLLASANNVPYGQVDVCDGSCGGGGRVISQVYADARGDALAYIVSDADTPAGTYSFETRNIAGRTGQATFTVLGDLQPTLGVAPESGVAGTSFELIGEGFLPNDSAISVQINGVPQNSVGSDSTGAVRFTINTSGTTPAATYTVRLTDSAERSATVSYQVTAPPANAPRMTVSPASGAPGTSFSFSGSGFAANAVVSFALDGQAIGQTTTTAAGTFLVTLNTSATIAPGSYTMAATQGAREATASFQISGGGGGGDPAPSGSGLYATLVWTDPPGQPGAARALVNNLNLRVNGPGGPYFGNGGDGPDTLNNVETVRIEQPAAGTYTIVVEAASVNATFGAQPFAVLATTSQNFGTNRGDTTIGGNNRLYLPLLRR